MTTPRARREGRGPASRGHAPKPRPHVTAARALARHDSPLGAEPDAQSVRCRPEPGGARAQQNRHLRRRGSGAAGGSRHLSNLPLQPVRLTEADGAPPKRPRSVWHTVGAQWVAWRLASHTAHKQSGALRRPVTPHSPSHYAAAGEGLARQREPALPSRPPGRPAAPRRAPPRRLSTLRASGQRPKPTPRAPPRLTPLALVMTDGVISQPRPGQDACVHKIEPWILGCVSAGPGEGMRMRVPRLLAFPAPRRRK